MSILNPAKHIVDKKKAEKQLKEDQSAVVDSAQGLLNKVKSRAEADQERTRKLTEQQNADAVAYDKRKQNMKGGSRKGLMFQGDATGTA